MKKLLTLTSLIVASLLGSSLCAQAQFKVGTVDMNKVFSSYWETKKAEDSINEARTAAKKELDDRVDSYKKNVELVNKLNDDLNKAELSKEKKEATSKQRDEKIAEIKNLEREIGEFRNTRERQLQEQAVRMRNGIVEKITKIVQEHVRAGGYDLVLDKSGSSLNGVPIVLYSKDSEDFSQDIITELNKSKPADAGKSSESSAPEKKKQH